jgi:hypothetical protein
MKTKFVAMVFAAFASVTFLPATAHGSPPPPVVQITPETGLLDGQTVSVDLIRFPVSGHATLVECLAPRGFKPHPKGGTCGIGTTEKDTTDVSGKLTHATYVIAETFTDRNGDTVHCASVPPPPVGTACVLLVTVRSKTDGREFAYADLPFAP